MEIVLNEDGIFEKYCDTYDLTIHCICEEDMKHAEEMMEMAAGQKIRSKEFQNKGWIPADIDLPPDNGMVLLSFCNFSLPMIGRYEQYEDGSGNWYLGDDDGGDTCLENDLYVNAWMPLPGQYKEE